jgi:hypothetical protein
MLRAYKIVGTLAKARTPGARSAKHDYVAILHVPSHGSHMAYTRYLYASELAQIHTIYARYIRLGIGVRLELSPQSPYTSIPELIQASTSAALPRGHNTGALSYKRGVFDPFATPKPQTVAADPDLAAEDPSKAATLPGRKVLEERVANFDAKKVTKEGATKIVSKVGESDLMSEGVDKRADEIAVKMDEVEGEIKKLKKEVSYLYQKEKKAKEDGGNWYALQTQGGAKKRALVEREAALKKLGAELLQRPTGWRVAEMERLRGKWRRIKLDAQNEKKWGEKGRPNWQSSPEADDVRRRMNRLRGSSIEAKPEGGTAFGTGQGKMTVIGALEEYEDVDPTTDPMGYLLTDGWHKVGTDKNGQPINDFTTKESNALLSVYLPMGERILRGRVWKYAKTAGYFTQFPGLAKDEEFRADMDATVYETILDVAKHYIPIKAGVKLDNGITFPMYLKSTLEGKLRELFTERRQRAKDEGEYLSVPVPGSASKEARQTEDELNAELYVDNNLDPRGIVDIAEHRYIDAEESVLLTDAEEILQRRLPPEMFTVLMAKLNIRETEEATATPGGKLPAKAKTWRDVAEALRDRHGGSVARWERDAPALFDQAVTYLRDERTTKLSGHEKAAVAAGLRVYADILAHRKAGALFHGWRRAPKGKTSKPEALHPIHTVDAKMTQGPGGYEANTNRPLHTTVLEEMQAVERQDSGKEPREHTTRERMSSLPHIAFWMKPENEALTKKLALHLAPRIEVDKNGKETVIPHPFDARHYIGSPNIVVPGAISIHAERMKRLYEAHKKLEKVDALTLRRAVEPAAKMLDTIMTHTERVREYTLDLANYEDDLVAYKEIADRYKRRGVSVPSKYVEPTRPTLPTLPPGMTPKDILLQSVKIGEQKIARISGTELRTMIETIANAKETKKSFRTDTMISGAVNRLVNELADYEAIRGAYPIR